ncbi:MAG: glycogen debranching protein GlgX [Chloroflexota bacterium]
MTIHITPGQPTPFGATPTNNGTNFALFSRHATRVWLLLFDNPTDGQPRQEIQLNPIDNRTGDVWHIHLTEVGHGDYYLYRVEGPYQPEQGHRFNPHKPLLDPYAKALTGGFTWDLTQSYSYDLDAEDKDNSFSTSSHIDGMPKCIIYGYDGFDWQGDRPLNRPLNETIIYETHVQSLTADPSANVAQPGTFQGIIDKIPYFKDLGVTAIELLPIHAFYEWEFTRFNPETGERLPNYWGYNTLAFFAPHGNYSHLGADQGQQIIAFKEMVRALHQAGLEIILDVVFNHTVENDHLGRTLSFRGLDNSLYYLLEKDLRRYKNLSGVGNSFNCNHPIGRDFIIDCLRYWVQEMHVDGFRFDLATSLSRDRWGDISGNPALPARIAEDPILRTTKLIAEPWDLGGYQVGHFPGGRWAEWNDKYRDEVRGFWRGDPGLTGALATRLAGSADLYYANERSPNHSINYIAAHDGFTLNDLVSYNEKHNEANGEGNRDGHNHNLSFNYGTEGWSDDPEINATRLRQVKNFIATLLLSQGTPMLNGGDEFRRSQQGNNNAYCQDNEISWYNWDMLGANEEVLRFTQQLIALRQANPIFRRTEFFTGQPVEDNTVNDIHWFGPDGQDAQWADGDKWLMCTMTGQEQQGPDEVDVLMIFNADDTTVTFQIPSSSRQQAWHLVFDTSLETLGDEAPLTEVTAPAYQAQPRSMVVLITKST